MTNSANIRSYTLGERECATLAELAAAMNEDLSTAIEHLDRGYIQKWIEEDLRAFDARIELDRLMEKYQWDRAVFEFAYSHGGGVVPNVYGLPLDEELMTALFKQRLKDDYIGVDSSMKMFAVKLFDWRLLTDQRFFPGNDRLARIDAIWREECDRYFTARGDMLLYEAVYTVPGLSLDDYLYSNRAIELTFAERALNPGGPPPEHYQEACEAVAAGGTLEILIELWTADEPNRGLKSAYPIEGGLIGHQLEDACKRPWFVDYRARRGERSLGVEAALRDAARIATRQTWFLENSDKEAAANPDIQGAPSMPLDERISALISKLDPVKQAALFAIPVFLLLLTFDMGDRWFDERGSYGWLDAGAALAVGLTIGLVPLRLVSLSKPGDSARSWLKLPVLGLIAFFTGSIMITIFKADLYYSTVMYEAGFALLAAAAGFFRNNMLAFKEGKRREKEVAQPGNVDSTNRISLIRLNAIFFPEETHLIPPAERTYADYQTIAAMQHGGKVSGTVLQHADARSPVAPNNPNGVSVNAAGLNFGGGNTTFDVVDGVSMDTQGNWNMRVVDGVTLHSDGKHTTRVTDGLDIRSDGQISSEVGGFRFSFGGKDDKKKDEWDWGTGEKKQKGWFD